MEERISDKLDKLITVLEKKEEEKASVKELKGLTPWIPWGAKVGKKKAQKGFITVMKINYNNTFTWERHEIKDGTIIVDGVPRVADKDVLYRKGKPFLIVHQGSTQPISTIENLERYSSEFKVNGWRLLLNRIKTEGMIEKKQINIGTILIVLGGLAALAFFAYKGGWI